MTSLPKRIVFTGGHHNSALAVALALKKQGYQIFWLGHKYSMWGDKNPSAEYREVTAAGIPFHELRAGKFYRTFHPLKLARIPIGFFQALIFLLKIKPNLIVSFGGYLAVPVAVMGWFLKIPTVTHEQTSATGLSNKLIGVFAKEVYLTFASSLSFFSKNKVKIIGLPLDSRDIPVNNPPLGRPRICIVGGKQGAHQINKQVFAIIKKLVRGYSVFHQTGSSTVYRDYERALEVRGSLGPKTRSFYQVVDYFPSSGRLKRYAGSTLVVARGGAHAIYDLGITGTPALIIPIPWVVNDEQRKNAEILSKAGSAEIINEKDLTAEKLLNMINSMVKDIERYRTNAKKARQFFPTDAKEKMVDEIKQITG